MAAYTQPTTAGDVTSGIGSTGGNIVIPKPSNLTNGDTLVLVAVNQNTGPPALTGPDGFTEHYQASASGTRGLAIYSKPITDAGSEPSTYTVVCSATGVRWVGVGMRMPGVPGIEAVPASDYYSGASSTTVPLPGVTTTIPDAILVALNMAHLSATEERAWSASGYTHVIQAAATASGSSSRSVIDVKVRQLSASGATGDQTFNLSPATTNVGGFVVAFKAPVDAASQVTATRSTTWDIRRTVTKRHKRWTITDWLTNNARIAHRGGSKNFPEMSKYAYDRAVDLGYGALELSVARTSDGVWFGLHDASTNAPSGTTGVPDASTLTWAEIQAQPEIRATATDEPTQPTRPYATLTEILDAYYGTHVFFIDPKAAATHREELLDILDALPGDATESIVAKYYGNGDSAWAQAARTRGYKTWGYFYAGENWAFYGSQFDYLGLTDHASQTVWDDILSLGKPVFATDVTDQTEATTSLAKGASALMVETPKTVSVAATPGDGSTWAVLNPVTATRSTTWAIDAPVTVTRPTSWDVASTVTASRSTTWDARAHVTATRATTWDATARVTATRSTNWTVSATDPITAVDATRETTWDVAARVTATRVTTWEVREQVGATRPTTWDIRGEVTAQRATTWDLEALLTVERATTWGILTEVTATRSTLWDVRYTSGGARDITITIGPPAAHALHIGPALKHPLSIGTSAGNTLRIESPRS